MSKFILENQHLPKLRKINRPENPYHPAVSGTSTEISRVFLLNDRGKVSFTESSEESESEESHLTSPSRFPTFQSPSLNLPDSDNSPPRNQSPLPPSCTGSRSSDLEHTPFVQRENKKEELITREPNFISSETPQFNDKWESTSNLNKPIENTRSKKSQNNFAFEDSSKLNEQKSSNYYINSLSSKTVEKKVYVSSYPQKVEEQPENIFNRYAQGLSEADKYIQEDVADEEQTEKIVEASHLRGISLHLGSAIKPVLQSASKVMAPTSSGKGRGSLIEQLQIDTFVESQVVENQESKSNQTTTKKRKFKIFGNNWHKRSPSPSPNLNTIEIKANVSRLSPEHQKVSEFDGDRVERNENKGRNYNYSICPHTECILKSLQIIDKLTDQKDNITNLSSKDKHIINVKEEEEKKLGGVDEEIEVQSLDISLEMDKFLLDLSLESLNNEETIKIVKKMKIAIGKLITKIKDRNLYQKRKPYLNWELCGELQRICKVLHCVEVVQERYTMWKLRLHHLEERIKDILKVNKQKQMEKLADIKTHMLELNGSRFYGSDMEDINIAGHYNRFIDQELKELEGAVESIENIILGH